MNKTKYELEERNNKFGENVIQLCKGMEQDTISKLIISQLFCLAIKLIQN